MLFRSRYSPGGDSPCGCADAAGNVWEWTAREWESGSERRVLRGGAFGSYEGYVRCAFRDWGVPYVRRRGGGFRMCVVSQQD